MRSRGSSKRRAYSGTKCSTSTVFRVHPFSLHLIRGSHLDALMYLPGHEAQYIVISVVRTTAPGFLHSRNRTNVMLTCCKRGLVLVSKRDFLIGPGRTTLLGELAQRWYRSAQRPNDVWINALELSDGGTSLPGVPGASGRPAIMAALRPIPSAPFHWPMRSASAASLAGNAGSVSRSRDCSWATVAKSNLTATRSTELQIGSSSSGRVTPSSVPPSLRPSTGMLTRGAIPSPYSSGSSPVVGPPLHSCCCPLGVGSSETVPTPHPFPRC